MGCQLHAISDNGLHRGINLFERSDELKRRTVPAANGAVLPSQFDGNPRLAGAPAKFCSCTNNIRSVNDYITELVIKNPLKAFPVLLRSSNYPCQVPAGPLLDIVKRCCQFH
jgi:hypothetical protein